MTQVQHVVCQQLATDVSVLLGTDRQQEAVRARHLAFYLERTVMGRTYPEIAKIYGRDHTTVIAAVNHVTERYERGHGWFVSNITQAQKTLVDELKSTNGTTEALKMTCPTCGGPLIAELQRQVMLLKEKLERMEKNNAS